LGLSEEEIKENERMWREENGGNLTPVADASSQMRSIGITPGSLGAETGAQDQEADPAMAAAAEQQAAAPEDAAAAAPAAPPAV
jgi:hypothetical protein